MITRLVISVCDCRDDLQLNYRASCNYNKDDDYSRQMPWNTGGNVVVLVLKTHVLCLEQINRFSQ